MMKSDDRSFSEQRCWRRLREVMGQTSYEKSQTVGRFEVEPPSRPLSDVNKEYGTLIEAKKDKSKKEEPMVYSGQVNMEEVMYEAVGEWLESLLDHRSITSVKPVLQNPNPDSESSMSSCVSQSKKKRCSINVEERSRKKRKTVVSPLEVEPIQTTPPDWLLNVMRREENGYNPKLISTRQLYNTDLAELQARLSVPFRQVKTPDFLTEDETRKLHRNAMKLCPDGVSVDLVDPLLKKHVLELRKWKMSGNWNYVFVKGWKNVLDANSFKEKDVYPLWSFRSGTGKLCFALIPKNSSNGSLPGGDGASTSGGSGQVRLPIPPSHPGRDSSHSGQGCSGESSSSSS
ncbi:hypothetical protein ISN45_Aa04g014120 [Arabidopsis thaliana x Arabidopsis arenosa]|uniref:TF-B3 domain-containing protein n=1 Tax=Arabidopsis thaliana x Arabidopsis arenosa TaxID=1240361 RepID=A0A8T2A7G9_9BRAS|nr:hypothetical protein ISN45_Aa04g014120 [Arabidopsis thaliana x Arabidopsis arenosa]